jgi:predicted SprT family Zn-dependent metalloprotease
MKFTTVSPQIRIAFESKIEEVLEICRKKSGKDIPSIPIKFSQMGRNAGVCKSYWTRTGFDKKGYSYVPGSSYIVINPDFFKNYYDDMLNDTCPHEVAHYVAVYLYGIEGNNHGYLWRMIMSWIGVPAADRCHQYSLEGVKVRHPRDYHYTCGCPGFTHCLTLRKHERHQFLLRNYNNSGFICKNCRQHITWVGFKNGEHFIPLAQAQSQPVSVPRTFVNVEPTPAPSIPKSEPTYRLVTKFVNGVLTNVKVPINA